VKANFEVLQLNIIGSRKVTDFDGTELSEKDLAAKYGVHFTPTFQFFGERAGALKALSLQYHERKDEFQYIIKGALDMELGGPDGALTKHRMQAGDTLHITPGTRHRLTAVEDSDIFEVSTPELEDVVRIEDRYGRAGT